MSFQRRKLLMRVIASVLSVLLVVCGVLLAVSCVQIYRSGTAPFTRESVGEALSRIAVPLVLTLALAAFAGVFCWIFPREEQVLRAKPSEEVLLSRLIRKKGESPEAAKEAKWRLMLRFGAAAALVAATVVSLVLLLNGRFYATDATYNEIVLRATLVAMACFLPALSVCVAVSFLLRASVKREFEILRSAEGAAEVPEEGKKVCLFRLLSERCSKNEKWVLTCVRILLLAAVAVLIAVGIVNGGMSDVLGKAINICTECIGLG